MIILYIFIFGLIVGSFLNVVIFRLESGEKIVNDRSRCLRCKHILAWYDLIPIFSFIFLKGKCRYCGKRISWQYPMVELGTGILFVSVVDHELGIMNYEYLTSNLQYLMVSLLFCFYVISALIVIFVYDFKHYIIPDKIIYPAIVVVLGFNLFNDFVTRYTLHVTDNNSQFSNFLFAAFISGAFFYSIVVITKGKGMGGGDIKLGFLMGLILGWPLILIALFLSFITGS